VEMSRHSFLQLAAGGGAALAAGLGGKAVNKLIPYLNPPEGIQPGEWTLYATTCRECPAGCGMHVRCTGGRPIKCEGNPDHPVNRGGLCARGQSAVQGLYDPDRVKQPLRYTPDGGYRPASWQEAFEDITEGLRFFGRIDVISDVQTGALAEVMESFAAAFGTGPPISYEAFSYEPLRAAHETLFGRPVVPDYRLDRCDFILSFGADFLETWISPVQFARQFAQVHSWRDGDMGRMVYIGPRLSMTAANADEFVQVPPGAEGAIALAMLKAIVEHGWATGDLGPVAAAIRQAPAGPLPDSVSADRVRDLARAFAQAQHAVALAAPSGAHGEAATAAALAAALLNYATGRIGDTADLSRPHALGHAAKLDEVRTALSRSAIRPGSTLIIHNTNPGFSLPRIFDQSRWLDLRRLVYLGTMPTETANVAAWVLPIDSPLEAWGDYEPYEGLHGLMQPAIRRLYDTRPAGDIFLAIARAAGKPLSRQGSDRPIATFEEWLRNRWTELGKRLAPNQPPADFWRQALAAGGAWEEARPAPVALRPEAANLRFPAIPSSPLPEVGESTAALWLWPSVMLYDGRGANRGWLQEAPDPTTTIVWQNWVDMHPHKAAALGLADGDVIEIHGPSEDSRIQAPVRVTVDVEEHTIAVAFGQGHTALGRNAAGRGANAFQLLGQSPAALPFGAAEFRKTGRRVELVHTCATQDQHEREILQWVPTSTLRQMQPGDGEKLALPLPEEYDRSRDLYAPAPYKEHRWAMVVDLARCIGCGACAVACYAENNCAVLGEDQVRRGRLMAWLRIVPYRDQEDPRRLGFLPLLCQQCDAAPCEPVCPVFASVHNEEGLNAQVYNRCIGTRYCSNNCPYKVRRFNWLNVQWAEPLTWQLNPDVTVRVRGVMEKCTFCIQRIREAELRAKHEGRAVRDGEIQPACAQSCPTRAFVFGDLLDPESQVSKLTRSDPRRYHVLESLNTKPAVTYLRRIKQPET